MPRQEAAEARRREGGNGAADRAAAAIRVHTLEPAGHNRDCSSIKFCLLHGKWHDGSCWSEVAELLRAAGDDVVAPDLPLHDPATTYRERIEPALAALRDGPAVIVAHSLAAAYAPLLALEVADPFLIYLCPAPVLPLRVEGSPPGTRADFPFPADDANGISTWDPGAALAAMYPRVPRDKALDAAARLKPAGPAAGPYPLVRHPGIPAALVYAAEDEFFEPVYEQYTAREVLHTEPIEIPGGHFPMLAAPESLAALLRSIAQDRSRA